MFLFSFFQFKLLLNHFQKDSHSSQSSVPPSRFSDIQHNFNIFIMITDMQSDRCYIYKPSNLHVSTAATMQDWRSASSSSPVQSLEELEERTEQPIVSWTQRKKRVSQLIRLGDMYSIHAVQKHAHKETHTENSISIYSSSSQRGRRACTQSCMSSAERS